MWPQVTWVDAGQTHTGVVLDWFVTGNKLQAVVLHDDAATFILVDANLLTPTGWRSFQAKSLGL